MTEEYEYADEGEAENDKEGFFWDGGLAGEFDEKAEADSSSEEDVDGGGFELADAEKVAGELNYEDVDDDTESCRDGIL